MEPESTRKSRPEMASRRMRSRPPERMAWCAEAVLRAPLRARPPEDQHEVAGGRKWQRQRGAGHQESPAVNDGQ